MSGLVSNLLPEDFTPVKEWIDKEHGGDPLKLELLLRKGVYPYDYFTDMSKFEDELPPRSAFYNSLTETECSPEDYRHAVKVWNVFKCRSLKDFCEIYIKSDVLLLAAVMEKYRQMTLKSHGLDPVHYFTLPGLTWDAGLKMTKVELELVTDENMYLFIEVNFFQRSLMLHSLVYSAYKT